MLGKLAEKTKIYTKPFFVLELISSSFLNRNRPRIGQQQFIVSSFAPWRPFMIQISSQQHSILLREKHVDENITRRVYND